MTTALRFSRSMAVALALAACAIAPAGAQSWLGGGQAPQQQGQMGAADVGLRIGQLEEQLRRMNGRVEQLEFQNRQLQEQLKRFQEDVEFRLGGQGGARPSATPPRSGAAPAATPPTAPVTAGGAAPTGPGAPPQNLGTLPASGAGTPAPGGAPLVLAPPGAAGASGTAAPGTMGTIAAPSDSPDDEFALATGFLQRKDYDLAEVSFRQFTESHPQDRRVGEALYGLGESFYQRGRPRDAIEPFLTVVTDHAASAKAPDALLRLGQALAGIGEKENACATFAEIDKKYPRATNAKSQGARERQRIGC